VDRGSSVGQGPTIEYAKREHAGGCNPYPRNTIEDQNSLHPAILNGRPGFRVPLCAFVDPAGTRYRPHAEFTISAATFPAAKSGISRAADRLPTPLRSCHQCRPAKQPSMSSIRPPPPTTRILHTTKHVVWPRNCGYLKRQTIFSPRRPARNRLRCPGDIEEP
jgi:hypothetical protein